jgi:hypothetical protein
MPDVRPLRDSLRLVGAAKAASHHDAVAAHLALPIGVRLARAVALSEEALRLFHETASIRPPAAVVEDEAVVWARVYAHLHLHDGA